MIELADTVSEAVERSHGEKPEGPNNGGGGGRARSRWNLNSTVAISVAITATFTALCNVKKGNLELAMSRAQASGVDAWAYYQAKGTKLNVAESALDGLRIQRATSPNLSAESQALIDLKLDEYVDKVRRYDAEKAEIKRSAEAYQERVERLDARVDRFDLAEALMSIAVALYGITALTQKRRLLVMAWVLAAAGALAGVAGFLATSPVVRAAAAG